MMPKRKRAQCSGVVLDKSLISGRRPCKRHAIYQEDGRPYCKIHSPSEVAIRKSELAEGYVERRKQAGAATRRMRWGWVIDDLVAGSNQSLADELRREWDRLYPGEAAPASSRLVDVFGSLNG